MKIAIIGNGSTAIKNENGKFIDNCDLVLRIKNFQLNGYEKWVGSKTDWYASKWFCWFDRVTFEPLPMLFTKNIKTFMFMFFDPLTTYQNFNSNYVNLYSNLQLKNEFPLSNGNMEIHKRYIEYYGLNDKNIIYMEPTDIEELAVRELRLSEKNYDKKGNKLVEPTVGIRSIYKMLKLYPNAEIFISGFDGFVTSWYWDVNHKINQHHNYLTERLFLNKIIKTKRVINLDE